MAEKHRFSDEWIARAAGGLPGVTAQVIARLRAEKQPMLAYGLVAAGLATPETLGQAVRKVYGIRPEDPSLTPDKLAVSLVPEAVCRRFRLIPVRLRGDTIEVAMADPLDPETLAQVRSITGREAVPVFALPDRIERLLGESFSNESVIFDLLDQLDVHESVEVVEGGKTAAQEEALQAAVSIHAPVIKLANALITKALQMRASDIHIEQEEKQTNVRFRVDGVLKNVMTLPHSLGAGALVARIKIMSDLDIAEHRKPQDGRAKLRVGANELGLRVSILPTSFGEKVVLRLLDPRSAQVPLEKMGFLPETAERLIALLGSGQGLLLVTGPTGSGKTTTLYAMLNRLRGEHTNIVTVEDPIEYKLPGVNQVQVQAKQGLGFAEVLRSVLRQDPNVILVGEIRDAETADIAFQAALTGHFVLSTLHTNDTVGSITRLVDMGVERFKLAPALVAITAQRLVRRLCSHCRAPVSEPERDKAAVAALARASLPSAYYRSVGCAKCLDTGFLGRLSLLEVLEITPELRAAIAADEPEAALQKAALQSGSLHTLLTDALRHLSQGDTTLEELLPYVSLSPKGAASPENKAARRDGPEPPKRERSKAAASAAREILITDDDPAIRILLRRILEEKGYSIIEAQDGREALDIVAKKVPDLLLLDLDMPNLDGYGVVRGLRQGLGLLNLSILILTADKDDASQVQALRLGADDYITKPFKPDVVLARVEAAFRRQALL